jgi:hypothetical protein
VKPKQIDFVGLLLIGAAVWVALSGGGLPGWTIPGLSKPTAVTFFYEKDSHAIPSPVLVALDKLNRSGIVATTLDVDTVDGAGETPAQYQVSLPAAKEAGLPSLVVMGGAKVLRTIKGPTTEAQVIEAAK